MRFVIRVSGSGILSGMAVVLLQGCVIAATVQPAVLEDPGRAERETIQAVIRGALQASHVLLAEDALEATSIVTIEPERRRRLDGLSGTDRLPGPPEQFVLQRTNSGKCHLLREQTGEIYPLPGVRCHATGE